MRIFHAKGWSELTADEREWINEDVSQKNVGRRIKEACYRNRSVTTLAFLLRNYSLTAEDIQGAITEAAEYKKAEHLRVLFDYCRAQPPAFYDAWKTSFGFFSAIGQAKTAEVWQLCRAFYAELPEQKRSTHPDIVEAFIDKGYADGVLDVLREQQDFNLYKVAMLRAVTQRNDVGMVRTLAPIAAEFGAEYVVKEAVADCVASGRSAHLDEILKACPDIDVNDGKILQQAALSGDMPTLKVLAQHGARYADFIPEVIDAVAERHGEANAATLYLDGFCEGVYIRKAKAAEAARKYGNRYKLMDDDSLVEIKNIPGGGTLTMIFNFAMRQQTVVVDCSRGVSQSTVPFSAIESAEALEQAAATFVALGGDPRFSEGASLSVKKQRLTAAGTK